MVVERLSLSQGIIYKVETKKWHGLRSNLLSQQLIYINYKVYVGINTHMRTLTLE